MGDPRVRASLLRLFFAFPALMAVTCPRSGPLWPVVTTIVGVESILALGLAISNRVRACH